MYILVQLPGTFYLEESGRNPLQAVSKESTIKYRTVQETIGQYSEGYYNEVKYGTLKYITVQ